MATSGSFNTSKVGDFYFTFSWKRTGYSSNANEHYIYYEVIAHNAAGKYRTVYLKNLWINGSQKFYTAGTSGNGKSYYDGNLVTSGNMTIGSSNSAGDGYIVASFEAGVGQYPNANTSGEGSWDLDRIPRYASVSQSLNSRTVNTIKMNWSSDSTIDYIWYSTNNGSNWSGVDVSDGTSGNYTISGLSPNTTYQIKTRVRRKDSQLTTDSSILSVTTYEKGTISSAPNFNDEENPTITYSNPAGNTVSTLSACISLTGAKDDIPYRDISKTGTTYTFNLTNNERTTLRKASSNSSELNIKFYVKTVSGGVTYYSIVDKKMTIKDGQPIFSDFTVAEADEDIYERLTRNRTKFIRKYSDIKITISSGNKMVAQKEATPTSYNINVGEKSKTLSYSTDTLETTIDNMDYNKVEVYAIDSRNKQTPVFKSLDIIDYKELVLNNIEFNRKNSVEETILITGNGTWTNVDFGNVVNSIKSFVFRRKSKNDIAWSDWYSIKEFFHINEDGTFNNKIENEFTALTFHFGEEYDIEIKIEDELSVATRNISVNSGKILMSALKEYGVNFGGIYDKEEGGVLQVNGKNIENLSTGITGDTLPIGSVVDFDGTEIPGNWIKIDNQKILWNDYYYMQGSHVVSLPEKVSEQENGIILVFSGYSDGQPKNWNWSSHFVSKKEVELSNGGGRFFIGGGTQGLSCFKYIYIYDDRLEGNDCNILQNGTYDNKGCVLRYVLGV